MVYITERADFDDYLEDTALTLLVFVDDDDEAALGYHDTAQDGVPEAWRVAILVADDVLTSAEVTAWGASHDRYVILGGNATSRFFVESDGLSALDRADGKPSILKIKEAFAEGDAA